MKRIPKVPIDLQKGARFGLLTLTGNWNVDKHQARLYEAVCECGGTVFRCAKEIRKSVCCSVKTHPELRKPNNRKKDRLNKIKDEYIGKIVRGHEIIEIYVNNLKTIAKIRCVMCNNVLIRNLNMFLDGRVNGCNRLHKEDIERNIVKKEKLRMKKARDAEQRKKDRIKENKGVCRYKDLTGQTFGRLTVLEYAGAHISKNGSKTPKFKCICECGEICIVLSSVLRAGRKLCDKELLEFKREQASYTNKLRADRRIKEGRENTRPFRRRRAKQLGKLSVDVYEKYQGVCQKCKQIHPKIISHCHHMIPVASNNDLALLLSNGILLCEECHEEFHKEYGYEYFNPKDVFRYIKS